MLLENAKTLNVILYLRLKDFISDKIEYCLSLADLADNADDIRDIKINYLMHK
ncbi:hypothetical protein SAMN05421542_0121 [Chryseobacterium jejuense]|uniref:Uncharacterized protein n=1 Tax=Chryseobacterium jejuense TaxID=445960 RepID=A0A2X2X6R8_CHRJE|nr:hypothetical protein SAMN05421542_0121 [Chryseobacterium jejuense]SQB46391.1 Uncharacterised protein [Chryseobacterium jejuense]